MEKHVYVPDIAFGAFVLFLFGILAGDFHWNVLWLFIFFIPAAIVATWEKMPFARVLLFLFSSALFAGIFYSHLYLAWQKAGMHLPGLDSPATVQALVVDEPRATGLSVLAHISLQQPFSGSILIFTPAGSDLHYGDLVTASGMLRVSSGFDDPAFFSTKMAVLARHKGWWVIEKLFDLKHALIQKFDDLLPSDQAALLAGIVLGFKADFDADTKRDLSLSGTTHIVAVSGYNITIVAIAVSRALGGAFSRRTLFYLILCAVVLFVLMTGVQASAVRAAVMAFVALLAKESGRLFNMRNAIAATAVLMTIADPSAMTNDLGFSLSFLSLIGIVYLEPVLAELLGYTGAPSIFDWKANAITTLSAQIGVMPVIVHSFGVFSLTAIIANVLILCTVPPAMFFGFLLAVTALVFYPAAFLIARCAGVILGYELFIIRSFGKLAVPLPFAFDTNFFITVYYSAIALIVILYERRKKYS